MIEVDRISALDDAWRAFLLRLSSNSFFCSTDFAELWRSMGGSPTYWVVTDGGRPAAILPAVEFGRSFLARIQAMPEGCYGRFVIDRDLSHKKEEYWSALISALLKERYAKVYLFDFYNTMPADNPLQVQLCSTIIVDIAGDWKPPGREERRVMRKAEEEGLTIVHFETDKHLDEFMDLMHEAERMHGRKPRYTRRFFRSLGTLSQKDDRVVWVVCEVDGFMLSSYICFAEDDTIFYWQAYTNDEGRKQRASDFLVGTIAIQSAARGIRHVNLGSTPGEIDGVRQWKLKWGGREHKYPLYTYHSAIGKVL